MTCGCNKPVEHNAANKAAMCQTCPKSIKHGGSAVTCSVNGKSVTQYAHAFEDCSLGRFKATGEIRWCGVDWLGTPEPLRWVLTWQLGRNPRNLTGCGCIKAVKESWLGPWLDSWFEGITLLRNRFGGFVSELRAIR